MREESQTGQERLGVLAVWTAERVWIVVRIASNRPRVIQSSHGRARAPLVIKVIRNQATADADRIQATLDNAGNQSITAEMIDTLSGAVRRSLRMEGGGYRRDHLRAFAQR